MISSPAQTAWPQYYTCINKQYPLADRESHPESVSVFAHHPYIYVLVSFLGDIDIYIRVLNIHFFRRPRVPDFASRPFFSSFGNNIMHTHALLIILGPYRRPRVPCTFRKRRPPPTDCRRPDRRRRRTTRKRRSRRSRRRFRPR